MQSGLYWMQQANVAENITTHSKANISDVPQVLVKKFREMCDKLMSIWALEASAIFSLIAMEVQESWWDLDKL